MDILSEIQKLKKAVRSRPYHEYTALLDQSTTNAPIPVILKNNLSGPGVWTRVDIGIYRFTLASAFTVNKTIMFLQVLTAGDPLLIGDIRRVDANILEIKTYYSGALSDDVLIKASLSINIYH